MGMIIVSGCPRSGTSLCMDIHRATYKIERIFGKQFPQEQRRQIAEMMQENAPAIVKYFNSKKELDEQQYEPGAKKKRDFEDMNPEGFWEGLFTMKGIKYYPQVRNLLEELKTDWRITKVVSQGLIQSDPALIERVVFMLRHPYAVAKSQERLYRTEIAWRPDGTKVNLYKDIVNNKGEPIEIEVHSPEMFITVTSQAMRFFLMHRDIPFIIVNYEDLLSNPVGEITRIFKFNNKDGDLDAGIACVRQDLNRSSKHDPKHSLLWDDALFLHGTMIEFKKLIEAGDRDTAYELLESALEEINDRTRAIHKENNNYPCYRAKMRTNYKKCLGCRGNIATRTGHKKRSEAQDQNSKVADNWRLEPCPFECGMDPDNDPITIEESIAKNFFEHTIPLDHDRYIKSLPPRELVENAK